MPEALRSFATPFRKDTVWLLDMCPIGCDGTGRFQTAGWDRADRRLRRHRLRRRAEHDQGPGAEYLGVGPGPARIRVRVERVRVPEELLVSHQTVGRVEAGLVWLLRKVQIATLLANESVSESSST